MSKEGRRGSAIGGINVQRFWQFSSDSCEVDNLAKGKVESREPRTVAWCSDGGQFCTDPNQLTDVEQH